jgi:hypothetical protein
MNETAEERQKIKIKITSLVFFGQQFMTLHASKFANTIKRFVVAPLVHNHANNTTTSQTPLAFCAFNMRPGLEVPKRNRRERCT